MALVARAPSSRRSIARRGFEPRLLDFTKPFGGVEGREEPRPAAGQQQRASAMIRLANSGPLKTISRA